MRLHNEIYKYYLDDVIVIVVDNESKLDKQFKFYKNIDIKDQTLIYVCKDNTCSLPFTDVNLLKDYL